jgi:hypothetical protein
MLEQSHPKGAAPAVGLGQAEIPNIGEESKMKNEK